MKECIRSELDIEISTNKERTDVVTNCTMNAFNRSILTRRISTSRMTVLIKRVNTYEINLIVMMGKCVEIFKSDDKQDCLLVTIVISIRLRNLCCVECHHTACQYNDIVLGLDRSLH